MANPIKNYLADNLKFFRTKVGIGLSQEQLSRKLRIPRSTYSSYELGLIEPNINMLQKIAQHYGYTIDALLRYDFSNTTDLSRYQVKDKSFEYLQTLPKLKTYVPAMQKTQAAYDKQVVTEMALQA